MLTQWQHLCWSVVCDYCGEGDNQEYGGSIHYASERDARVELREMEWSVLADGRALHPHCFEELRAKFSCPDGAHCTGAGCGCCPSALEVFARLVTA